MTYLLSRAPSVPFNPLVRSLETPIFLVYLSILNQPRLWGCISSRNGDAVDKMLQSLFFTMIGRAIQQRGGV